MRELTTEERKILDQHALWLDSGGAEGERANLCEADLRGASLRGANLRGANLRGANLRGADLSGASLCEADLSGADLRWANLCEADLRGASLSGASLRGADLCRADLCEANLDFSSWPLWCGSRNVKIDDRLVAQLLWHVTRLDVSGCSGGVQEAVEHIRSMGIADLFCEYRDDVS